MPDSSISNYIRRLIASRKMTMMSLCQLLGYRSQTSLVRIMQEQVRHDSLVAFAHKLRTCAKLNLSAEERKKLDELVELHNADSNTTQALASIRRFLSTLPNENAAPPHLLLQDRSQVGVIAHFGTLRIRHVFILNCEHVSIFNDLALLMSRQSFTIEHYMFSSPSVLRSIHTLQAIMPVVFSTQYSAWAYRMPKEPSNTSRGLITSDMIVVEYQREDGSVGYEAIVFTSNTCGTVLQDVFSLDTLYLMLPRKEDMLSLKLDPASLGDLLMYLDFCADLEHNHAVYRLKPDVGMDQIPVGILKNAVMDSAPAEMLGMLDQLTSRFLQRQKNLLERKQPQYHIMKRKAMWQFAETGRMSDHLWCCRSFTRAERAAIFTFIRDELMTRPSIHIHILRDDDFLFEQEIVLYEGVGLSLIKPDTNYDWAQKHAEVLITHHEFLTTFRQYYTQSLLRYHVESEADTAALLTELIDFCTKSDPLS